jgi:CheY-like chemotaxis protein
MRTLLVIDDDPAWRSLYRIMFEGEFAIVEARDGQEGLALYEQVSPDLVIVDLRMPRMDGAAFLAELHGKPHAAPVIVCTAVNREAAWLARMGVRVVPKSPGLKELLTVVSSLDEEQAGRRNADPEERG